MLTAVLALTCVVIRTIIVRRSIIIALHKFVLSAVLIAGRDPWRTGFRLLFCDGSSFDR